MPEPGSIDVIYRPTIMKTTRYSSLQLETLEARDLPSSSPSPVLMVLANRDFYYTSSTLSAPAASQDSTFYGRGILRSTDGGQTWTLQNAVNQFTNTLQQSFDNSTPLASDYGQWRQRFGSGL